MTNDNFSALVMSMAGDIPPFSPFAHYSEEGDCLEIFSSNEPFRGERIDSLVTVYYGQDSGEIVGAFIKGIRTRVKAILANNPGLQIEVKDGTLQLSVLFAQRQLEADDSITAYRYQKLREMAETVDAKLELCEA